MKSSRSHFLVLVSSALAAAFVTQSNVSSAHSDNRTPCRPGQSADQCSVVRIEGKIGYPRKFEVSVASFEHPQYPNDLRVLKLSLSGSFSNALNKVYVNTHLTPFNEIIVTPVGEMSEADSVGTFETTVDVAVNKDTVYKVFVLTEGSAGLGYPKQNYAGEF